MCMCKDIKWVYECYIIVALVFVSSETKRWSLYGFIAIWHMYNTKEVVLSQFPSSTSISFLDFISYHFLKWVHHALWLDFMLSLHLQCAKSFTAECLFRQQWLIAVSKEADEQDFSIYLKNNKKCNGWFLSHVRWCMWSRTERNKKWFKLLLGRFILGFWS